MLLRFFFSLLRSDLPFIVEVGFITHQNDYNIVASLASNIIHPLAGVLK